MAIDCLFSLKKIRQNSIRNRIKAISWNFEETIFGVKRTGKQNNQHNKDIQNFAKSINGIVLFN